MEFDKKKSIWRKKYKTLKEYYENEYDPKFYTFNKHQLEIDPDETIEEINEYDEEKQFEELKKCMSSFAYFAQRYLKILHPMKGTIPFILFNYQIRCIKEFEENRWCIISKFRQGGLTTLAELWSLWKMLFKTDQAILFISKTDREACNAGKIIDRASRELPTWLQPNVKGRWNDHAKEILETSSLMSFYSPEASRGQSPSLLIVDECAHIPDMEEHWKAIYPVLSGGGSAILISTVNGLGNFYSDVYHDALEGKNKFHVIDLDYWEHPDYCKPEWVADMKMQLSDRGWKQEVLRLFSGGGDTYIPSDILAVLQQKTRITQPKRKQFPKFANKTDREEAKNMDNVGALWFYKEKQDDHDYIMGIDCAEGLGGDGDGEGDNSCIQVLDANTLEQVAEFYSNNCQPYYFAGICNQLGIYYNHAMAVVENASSGTSVLTNLQHEYYYDNLYYEDKNASINRPGLKTTAANRLVILECMQRRILNETVKVNSPRLVRELSTFIYNKKTEKPAASSGNKDDAVMAFSFALYVRDTLLRNLPLIGNAALNDKKSINNITFNEIKEQIYAETMKDLFGDTTTRKNLDFDELSTQSNTVIFAHRRKYGKLISEFFPGC